jgi:hypothetical protein
MSDDLRRHDGVGHERGPGAHADAVGEQEHLVENHRVPGVAGTAIDGDRGSLFDPIAAGTATDDGVHGFVDLSEQKKSPRGVRDVMKSIPDGRPFSRVLWTAVRSDAR